IFQHNERGNLTEVDDAGGILAKLGYDEANRPIQVTDANGAAQTFSYDAQQRLTRQQMPGGEKIFEYSPNGKLAATVENGERTELNYDNDGNLTESRTQRGGKNVRTNFNRNGKIAHQEVENGLSMNFEYDNKGHETAFVYSDIGRFEKAYDAAGRKIAEKLPSGLTYNYEYDANNKVTRKSDNRGNGFRTEYDASGALTKLVKNDGSWSQIIRDQAGRIVEMRNSRGKSRRYSYNARGALTEYIGADGRHFQFQYDARGTLQNAIKAQNASLIYQRDQPKDFFGIQKINQNSLLQIQNVNYITSFADSKVDSSSINSADDPCLFGNDGYSFADPSNTMDVNYYVPSQDPFSSCNDPFAGMWDFGDLGLGGEQETCEQCRARQRRICDNNYSGCNWDRTLGRAAGGLVVGGGAGAAIGTAVPAIGNVIGGIAGGLIGAVGGGISGMMSCGYERDTCYESLLNADKCGAICNK
ncbi:MAG: hypothetical protein ACR2N3_19220, partial [Pyrinomonadaceae bacterium]